MYKYPLLLKPEIIEKVWGGYKFLEMLKTDNTEPIGESWELSVRDDYNSKIMIGPYKNKTVKDILDKFGIDFSGFDNPHFPILVKYLDINDKLSIQVHPDDNYALENENDSGKTECWYVMEASDDCKLILGLDKKYHHINNEDLKKHIENGNLDIYNVENIKSGDFIFIKPGLIHGTIDGSCLIAEIQQNSDTTYRVYDFDRSYKGKKRELHISKALDVIEKDLLPDIVTTTKMSSINLPQLLCNSDYFIVELINVKGSVEITNSKIVTVMIIEGEVEASSKSGTTKAIRGQTILLPSNELYVIKSDFAKILTVSLN
ncbi:MAG: class I mannose-6-phosphate isomerase [Candidatus Delongbacteria bacterium]|nr:class I mannose-6-phosphate isomerase [Candidatus Delongbacteria bacterium]MBN2834216.1 class I mannose-6-phosphate isomerase [Candidatus Delongbacteria bacterium]